MISSQVNRFILNYKWARSFLRFSHDDTASKVLHPLKNRSLVKVSGPESSQFLQGLITNDMNHFEDGATSIYAMFLNSKGRVLYDALIHKWGTDHNMYMVECDKSISHLLQKHLKIYKLKRDVEIGDVSPMFKIYALIAPQNLNEVSEEIDMKHNISLFKDPRLSELGYRLITSNDVDRFDLQYAIGKDTVITQDENGYQTHKCKLGVSEGAEDLFPGVCFPLEANGDYLHGISFHKGCYIGQELTARVHHTGVVRKRIMPIQFLALNTSQELQRDAEIWAVINSGRAKIGKLKNHINGYGLGLVRIKEALEAKSINIGVLPIEIIRPCWWPIEAPKEKIAVLKPADYDEKKAETLQDK